jgi:hypothetical protein
MNPYAPDHPGCVIELIWTGMSIVGSLEGHYEALCTSIPDGEAVGSGLTVAFISYTPEGSLVGGLQGWSMYPWPGQAER